MASKQQRYVFSSYFRNRITKVYWKLLATWHYTSLTIHLAVYYKQNSSSFYYRYTSLISTQSIYLHNYSIIFLSRAAPKIIFDSQSKNTLGNDNSRPHLPAGTCTFQIRENIHGFCQKLSHCPISSLESHAKTIRKLRVPPTTLSGKSFSLSLSLCPSALVEIARQQRRRTHARGPCPSKLASLKGLLAIYERGSRIQPLPVYSEIGAQLSSGGPVVGAKE